MAEEIDLEKCNFRKLNTPIGDRLFQDIPRRVAKFRENQPRDVNKKASIRWQDSARHQFQAGLRGDVGL